MAKRSAKWSMALVLALEAICNMAGNSDPCPPAGIVWRLGHPATLARTIKNSAGVESPHCYPLATPFAFHTQLANSRREHN